MQSNGPRGGVARYMPVLTGVLAALIILVVAMAYFYPDDIQGNRVLQQYDMMQGAANGQETQEFTAATGETSWWTNSLFSGMPTFQISPSYSSNRLFGWVNTLMGLGLPSPANLVFMMMAGMLILLLCMRMRWYVALLGALAYGFSSYFIIIIGAGHIWKFVTLAYIPPTIAGLVLCYRGRYLAGGALTALFTMMQIASNHVQMTYYFLFVIVGFVISYLCVAVREKTLRQFGIATCVLVVAGLLGVAANLPSLYNTYEYSKETIRGSHSELTRTDADNSDATSGLDRSYITAYSYEKAETFTLLIPNVKGGASQSIAALDEVRDAYNNGTLDPDFAQYLSITSQVGATPTQYFGGEEGTSGPVYVGALIFALFLVGCVVVRGPLKWVLLVLTVFSIALAWGRNMQWLTDLMINYMPMYSKFRTVESILVIAEFTMPLLAAMALQQLLSDRGALSSRAKKGLAFGFGVTLLICLAGIVSPGIFGDIITEADLDRDSMVGGMLQAYGASPEQVYALSLQNPAIYGAIESLRSAMVQADALRSFIIVALGLIAMVLYYRRVIPMWAVTSAVIVIAVVDLYTVNKRYLNTDSFTDRPTVRYAGLQKSSLDDYILQDTTSHYRVMNVPYFNSPVPSYYHKAIGGYHAAKLTRYQDIIDRHLSNFTRHRADAADSAVVDMLNGRYYIDTTADGQSLDVNVNDRAYGNAWLVDRVEYVKGADAEMNGLSTTDLRRVAIADEKFRGQLGEAAPKAPGDTIFLTDYAPNRLIYNVNTSRGGVAVFSEVYFPWGWRVYVDDAEQPEGPARVDYVLRALRLPSGHHKVVMEFNPSSVTSTVTVATVAVIVIFLLLACALGMAIARPLLSKSRKETAG